MKYPFLGTYQYAIDDRGRVPIPPRFRPHLKELGVVQMKGEPQRCVWLTSAENFEEMAAAFTRQPLTTNTGQMMRRQAFGDAWGPDKFDGQGRVLLTQQLRQYARLQGQVVVKGCGDHFEIWDPAEAEPVFAVEAQEYRRQFGAEAQGVETE